MKRKERPSLTLAKLKDKALYLLSRRDHSVRELKSKLRSRGHFEEADFEATIVWLKNLGYLADEKELSERWVKQWRSEGRGRHWIEGKIKVKGLPPPPLRDDEDELTAAQIFLSKKLRHKELKDLNYPEKAKIARSLVSRGFSSSVVASLLEKGN